MALGRVHFRQRQSNPIPTIIRSSSNREPARCMMPDQSPWDVLL